jgi:ABC-2 type transport system permease protein
MKKQNTRLNIVIQLALIAGIVLIVNLISDNFFKRYDLTDDGRHTISEVSEQYLDTLPQNVFVTIYYGGELPTHYKQFEDGMKTLLDELVISGNGHFDYQFVDPTSDPASCSALRRGSCTPFA